LGDERALGPLINSLADGDEYVRIYVYQALEEFGARAAKALTDALAHPDPTVTRFAGMLLDGISRDAETGG
jgi:HEAT repeat protein